MNKRANLTLITFVVFSILSDAVFATHETYTKTRYRTQLGMINPVPGNYACSWGPISYGSTATQARSKAVNLYQSCSGDSDCYFYTTQGYLYIYNCDSALISVHGPIEESCTGDTFLNPGTGSCEALCPTNGTSHHANYLSISGDAGNNVCQEQVNTSLCEIHADSSIYDNNTDQTVLYSPTYTGHFCETDDGVTEGFGPTTADYDKDNGTGCVGNPCNPATGNKFQAEVDYEMNSLTLSRFYNSNYLRDFGFGKGWLSTFARNLELYGNEMVVVESTGRSEKWSKTNGIWSGDADTDFNIIENNGFTLTRSNGHVETYNTEGRIVSESMPSGRTTNYLYNSNGDLTTATSHFGRSLQFSWNADGHVSSITTPAGGIYTYSYDNNDNLNGVQFPDQTTRIYHYENTEFPNHLTGITDENGVRYSTFSYDAAGRAISTGHANIGSGSQEMFQIDYGQ